MAMPSELAKQAAEQEAADQKAEALEASITDVFVQRIKANSGKNIEDEAVDKVGQGA